MNYPSDDNLLSPAELKTLAAIAGLSIKDEECASMAKDISAVLSYVQRLQTAPFSTESIHQNTTETYAMAEDVVRPYQGPDLVAASVEHTNNFYVVPSIIKTSKS